MQIISIGQSYLLADLAAGAQPLGGTEIVKRRAPERIPGGLRCPLRFSDSCLCVLFSLLNEERKCLDVKLANLEKAI